MDDLFHIFPPEAPAAVGVLERLETYSVSVKYPSQGVYVDPSKHRDISGMTYQRCGGGRRVIRKKIGGE